MINMEISMYNVNVPNEQSGTALTTVHDSDYAWKSKLPSPSTFPHLTHVHSQVMCVIYMLMFIHVWNRFCWSKKNNKSIGAQRLLPPDIDEKVTINMWDMVLVYNFSKNKDINERLSPKVKLKHLVMFTLKGGKYK